ncbi:hypothetical protein CIPAW_07G079300 [Carya illinoinensis]|uniref:Uncharacterized protein n=1 Tax=Carya illinoinensis TaxID=32201 RepID=A0A8T1PTE3_CARIL|nr:hypothetical protein CIPAW_07G079300 [Carya illinoinensis]
MSGLDTKLLEISGNQIGPLRMRMQENMQTSVMVDQESVQQEVMETPGTVQTPVTGTQESMQLWMDIIQLETVNETQPNSIL